ncbi:N-6 DNA methylase [Limosilactobacillus reuteri]|uniref:Restriction endonuclease subunit M n=1 Tax=Limosilactobacillus reuteri TaxID=1598 RepID=A0ABD6X802_LIMRT|nr:N-6 DNA methylase [Limosilactobacillus reuteri]PTM22792.1 restriction endonuclease subunit M [Limosilactobacillus reuteri]PTM27394.1 restriction endonuclease subunit M [Limosilactobacillus reuteri]
MNNISNDFSARETFKDIRNYLAGRFVGATRDEFLLEEVVKLIFCKNFLSKNTDKLDEVELSKIYRREFGEIQKEFHDIYTNDDEIQLDPISIKYVDERLNKLNLRNLNRDVIGDAYEIFIGENIKGQSGQFFTPQNATDALVELVDPKPSDKILDLACGAGGFLISSLRYLKKFSKQNKNLNLYGIDKDNYLVHLAKIHLACLGQDTSNIKCADSLVWDTNILGKRDNYYDVVLTNPPFGSNIQAGSNATLKDFSSAYKYRKRKNEYIKTSVLNNGVPPQVVFMEQCIRVVKPGGKIGVVVPESMVSSKKYGYVVDMIMNQCTIKAIIGMPDVLFKISGKGGTHTKTCLLVLEKNKSNEIQKKNYNLFIAEARWCGHDSRGRAIPKDDIPQVVANYEDKEKSKSNLGFIINAKQIDNRVLAPRAYLHLIDKDVLKLDSTHYLKSLGDLVNDGVLQLTTGNEVGKLAYGTGNIPFVRTSDISNWLIKSDPKHSVSQDIYDSLAEKQDVMPGDILMVKDGSYLIGTCAMVTDFDKKIIYQSHLYKIRVNPNNDYGLTPFYLIAALSSKYVKKQIFAKTFSQDIINSLGDRIKDVIVPISKDRTSIKRISSMVEKSISNSIHARELSKKASIDVLNN